MSPTPEPSPIVRAVLFDLGGVWLRLRSWPQACAAAGFNGEETRQLRVMDDHPEVAKAHLEYEHGRISTGEFMRRAGNILGADPSAVAAVFCTRIEGPFLGTGALLDRLEGTGIVTGCLSNTNALHFALMSGVFGDEAPQRIPLERLTHRFASQDLGCVKPEPSIYAAAERLLALPPETIAFFDDREDNVAAALARGWQAHRILQDAPLSPARQMENYLQAMGVLS